MNDGEEGYDSGCGLVKSIAFVVGFVNANVISNRDVSVLVEMGQRMRTMARQDCDVVIENVTAIVSVFGARLCVGVILIVIAIWIVKYDDAECDSGFGFDSDLNCDGDGDLNVIESVILADPASLPSFLPYQLLHLSGAD